MKVLEPDRMLDYWDLFVTKGDKPQFTSSKTTSATDEERDPFDDMLEEAKPGEE